MRRRLFLLFLAALPHLGCGGGDEEAHDARRDVKGENGLLHFVVDADRPLSQGANDVRLSLHEASTGAAFSGATVTVSALMPAMGHEAASPPSIESLGDGEYLIHGLALPMAGRWEVHITASRQGTSDEVTVSYDIP